MGDNRDSFARDWSLKWDQGVVVGFARERLDRTRAVGMLRTAHRRMGVDRKDLRAILDVVRDSPVYLPGLTKEEKAARMRPLREALIAKEI